MIYLSTFLPGNLILSHGCTSDYFELHHFHYIPRKPATFSDVWSVHYLAPDRPRRLAAVGVLSWPAACCRAREARFGLTGATYGEKLRFANTHLRTISRVIVHPQFRSLGLASILVRCLCENATTRYVEASARMAHAHPFFRSGGMIQINRPRADECVYFLFDREVFEQKKQYIDKRYKMIQNDTVPAKPSG